MPEAILDNVGRADAAVRIVLAVVNLALAGLAIRFLSADWALTATLAALPLAGYLLLTAAGRLDPIYLMHGGNTTREAREARRRERRMAGAD